MKDLTLKKTVKEKKENLTLRFVIAALLAVILSVCLMTAAAYYYLRTTALNAQMQIISSELVMDLVRVVDFSNFDKVDQGVAISLDLIRQRHKLIDMALLAPDLTVRWSSATLSPLAEKERKAFDSLINSEVVTSRVVDPMLRNWQDMQAIFATRFEPLVSFTPVIDQQANVLAVVRGRSNFDRALLSVGTATLKMFAVLLFGHLLVVLVLYVNFRRGIVTIEQQEQRLSEQIIRLSNLLTLNKSMQKSMKSASSRAVELNERFLRRVGADLHDGPAQSIGYSVLRLNKVSQTEESKKLGHEFHAVREALDNALTEIRGISSGLVLPELDEMTLEQCLNRVVSRHQSNTETKVSEFYQNLPEQLPMPIKICAYRFVQEGLNNASRHGQAEKCRVSAHVKDDVLHLSLKDNGMGFRKSQLSTEGGHLGLMGLKDRIESLGGKFSINSELGVGTAIKVSLGLVDDL